jgi:hypothetical protein
MREARAWGELSNKEVRICLRIGQIVFAPCASHEQIQVLRHEDIAAVANRRRRETEHC